MTLRAAALSMILIGAFSGQAAAVDRGSADDEAACEPDVHRLCEQFIPDEAPIIKCLQKEKRHLSPACAKVISRH